MTVPDYKRGQSLEIGPASGRELTATAVPVPAYNRGQSPEAAFLVVAGREVDDQLLELPADVYRRARRTWFRPGRGRRRRAIVVILTA